MLGFVIHCSRVLTESSNVDRHMSVEWIDQQVPTYLPTYLTQPACQYSLTPPVNHPLSTVEWNGKAFKLISSRNTHPETLFSSKKKKLNFFCLVLRNFFHILLGSTLRMSTCHRGGGGGGAPPACAIEELKKVCQ